VITAREILATLGSDPNDRLALQARGAELELATSGRWLLDGVIDRLASAEDSAHVFDSVRTLAQANLFKSNFPNSYLIHVTAAEPVLHKRFLATVEGMASGESGMNRAFSHEVERRADSVRATADLIIDTTAKSITDVCGEALLAIQAL